MMGRLIDKEPFMKNQEPLKVVVAGLPRTGTACQSYLDFPAPAIC